MDTPGFNEIAFPQIILFTVLVVIIIWLMSKNLLFAIIIGGAVYYLSYKGHLESIGIGSKPCVKKCIDYIINNDNPLAGQNYTQQDLEKAKEHIHL